MAYGAMIDVNGNPFITPNSIPYALYGKYSFNSYEVGSGSAAVQQVSSLINIQQSYMPMTFVRVSGTSSPTGIQTYLEGDGIRVTGANNGNNQFVVTVYVFAIFPQTLPDWGMAIWNEAGTLVLTNETKVLTDIETIGANGTGGVDITFNRQGSYAVSPARLGAVQLLNPGAPGQPPFLTSADIYTSCVYSGGSTTITSVVAPGQSGSPQGYTNNGNSLTIINTASYD